MTRSDAAVVGIGETEFTRGSGRSEWSLAIEAISAALDDAGLGPDDVDGLVRFSYDNTDEAMVVRSFGMSLRHYGQVGYGGLGAPAVLAHAAAAIAAGLARVVVCYRSLNGYSHTRYGRAERSIPAAGASPPDAPAGSPVPVEVHAVGDRAPSGAFTGPYGLLAPGQVMAMWATRYAYENGLGDDDLVRTLGTIAVGQRGYAIDNPRALRREPLDHEAYRAGRMISAPLRLCDFALESDGAVAVVVAAPDVAKRASRSPVWVRGAVHGLVPYAESVSLYGELRNGPSYTALANGMYAQAGLRPAEITTAMLYDATTVTVLLAYETYGFAPPGKGWHRLLDDGIGLDAPLPVNTNGGHLSEAYVHGMNLVSEAVRQCRGDGTSQVSGVEHVLCASGPSAIVLGP